MIYYGSEGNLMLRPRTTPALRHVFVLWGEMIEPQNRLHFSPFVMLEDQQSETEDVLLLIDI